MTCMVQIEFRANQDPVDKLPGWWREIRPATHCREGCVSVSVTRNRDDALNVAFVEPWDWRQHYESYFAWRAQPGVLGQLPGTVDGQGALGAGRT